MADWTCSSNEALTLSLARSEMDKEVLAEDESYEGFHPTFTYPIYGEEETIYGYKELVIDLKFASGSLAQYLSVKWSEKLESSSTVDDVEGTLSKFIPEDHYKTEDAFIGRVELEATSFQPLGEKIFSYKRRSPAVVGKGKAVLPQDELDPEDPDTIIYEVYHATWKTPGFREYHRRMQIFILLYIEGGSYINEEEDPWEFVVLYERRKRKDVANTPTYHFIGYSSLYPFYCYPERVRMRLSQFVIVPPYQRQGHGSKLYTAIYQYVLSRQDIAELTVEDPAEAFEDLRDVNDLKMLLSHKQFMDGALGPSASTAGGKVPKRKGATAKGKLGPPADKGWVEKWRRDLKMAGRQFSRLIEMLILLHMDPVDTVAAKAYRIQVKERIYRFNFEVLAQMEKPERQEKLEETFQSVKEDYLRILSSVR
ncbi:histone acetyltransferase type B [Heliocybe sulcata]|uniref:Histone acetyltransferase type B catalytic subunit n=1 Tax=Heliocybe sulcata TaxID=5364 RepID=A0A5C3MQQ7_9AGAM|nr:histone acetyltransferase type B [Heliocybe sulcata]